MIRRTIIAVVTAAAVVGTMLPAPSAATAAPTWTDVLAARGDETAAKATAAELTALIATLEDETAAAAAAAAARGSELQEAQDAADAAAGRYDKLTEQAARARKDAAGAEVRARGAAMAVRR